MAPPRQWYRGWSPGSRCPSTTRSRRPPPKRRLRLSRELDLGGGQLMQAPLAPGGAVAVAQVNVAVVPPARGEPYRAGAVRDVAHLAQQPYVDVQLLLPLGQRYLANLEGLAIGREKHGKEPLDDERHVGRAEVEALRIGELGMQQGAHFRGQL